MAVFKNYSFEYNAKSADIFKATAACITASEASDFEEGCLIDIDEAQFYGIIVESKKSAERLTFDITAESYARELRNNLVSEEVLFRQIDAIKLIKSHLLPEGWQFEYPVQFDNYPIYISYTLRNGTYISHISTILTTLGLDYTIYTTKSGNEYTKIVKAYFRDDFEGKPIKELKEWVDFGALSINADYGKIATSIVVMGSETEIGIDQVTMDAEMGDWRYVPRMLEIKDTQLKKPEFSDTSKYLWYFPASPTDYTIDQILAGDLISIGEEVMKVHSIWFLPGWRVASYENGDITDDELFTYFEPIENYVETGVIVASIDLNATHRFESVRKTISVEDKRNINAYCSESKTHAIYDPILMLSGFISVSSYLTFDKNLPAEKGFFWIGSERLFYQVCSNETTQYNVQRLVRGVPTCAVASCEHCGTREELRPIGWSYGCPYGGFDTNECVSKYCTLAAEVKTALGIETNIQSCPLSFDPESVCPVMKCPFVKNDTQFAALCPKGLTQSEIQWTERYIHNKNAIVFPDSYYYNDEGIDVYEIYARDSLINKYGYLPAQVQVKGISDADGLDKVAEGYLRLSALPITGKFTYFQYDPWAIPAGLYPGDVISIEVASKGRYDLDVATWYPTHWFEASEDDNCPGLIDEWLRIPKGSNKWYKIKEQFIIQKTVKSQRGMPEIYFGTSMSDFTSTLDYLKDIRDTTSQRHRNQELSKTVNTSENGYAAQVQNVKTGIKTWVRMIR